MKEWREKLADWIIGGPRIYKFGVGEVIVGHGSFGGKPCIGFCKPNTNGKLYDPAPEYKGKLKSKGVIIVFEGDSADDDFIRLIAKANAYASFAK